MVGFLFNFKLKAEKHFSRILGITFRIVYVTHCADFEGSLCKNFTACINLFLTGDFQMFKYFRESSKWKL